MSSSILKDRFCPLKMTHILSAYVTSIILKISQSRAILYSWMSGWMMWANLLYKTLDMNMKIKTEIEDEELQAGMAVLENMDEAFFTTGFIWFMSKYEFLIWILISYSLGIKKFLDISREILQWCAIETRHLLKRKDVSFISTNF